MYGCSSRPALPFARTRPAIRIVALGDVGSQGEPYVGPLCIGSQGRDGPLIYAFRQWQSRPCFEWNALQPAIRWGQVELCSFPEPQAQTGGRARVCLPERGGLDTDQNANGGKRHQQTLSVSLGERAMHDGNAD